MGIFRPWVAVEALADDAHGVSMMVKIRIWYDSPVCEKKEQKDGSSWNFGERLPAIVMV